MKFQYYNLSTSGLLVHKSLLVFIIIWLLTGEIVDAYATLSPRVVHTRQTQWQGILGPDNLHIYGFAHGHHPIVEIFKGIPYAASPTNNLRYESPAPPSLRSTFVYIANDTKAICPRFYDTFNKTNSKTVDPIRQIMNQIVARYEDCLYMDIYAPLNTHKNSGPGLPVLVFSDSSPDDKDDPFDGSSIAAIGQIIVVRFRYRVGILGFLKPGYGDDVRSNFGLWDQLAALQWIRENINSFGGDENNVCLMGNDIDASIAGILALSPLSQAYGGLFNRLILFNGSPFSPISINPKPIETTAHVARALTCPVHESDGELLTCFRRRGLDQLLGAGQNIGSKLLSNPFAPSVDGTLVKPELSDFIFSLNRENAELIKETLGRYDVLCGLGSGPVLPNIGEPYSWQKIDIDQFVTGIIKMFLPMLDSYEGETMDSLKEDLKRNIKSDYGDNMMKEVISDFLVVYPMVNLLDLHSETGKNTFFYVSKSYDPLMKQKQNELAYLFSSSVYKWRYIDYGQPNLDLQPFEILIKFISNFVKSGDPNVPNPNERYSSSQSPNHWPKYKKGSGRYLAFGVNVEIQGKYRRLHTTFWSEAFPAIMRQYKSILSPENSEWFPHSSNSNKNKFPHHFGNSRPSVPKNSEEDSRLKLLSGMTQSTVIIVGSLLLFLNLLCFLGLYYQRERLKKAEIQFRRRYLSANGQLQADLDDQRDTTTTSVPGVGGGGGTCPLTDSDSSGPYAVINRVRPPEQEANRRSQIQVPMYHHPHQSIPLDTMSETETDNGFGPDFLGPNYDPRTKVTRWMFHQNNQPNRSNPNGSFDGQDSEILDPMNSALAPYNNFPYLAPVTEERLLRHSQTFVEPPVPYQNPSPCQPFAIPLSDIPYADSRTTTPSIAGGHFNKAIVPAYNNNLSTNNFNNFRRNNPTSPTHSIGSSSTLNPTPTRNSIIVQELSVINHSQPRVPTPTIENVDVEVESSKPKLVPVKTGTLTRSVGVGECTTAANGSETSIPLTQTPPKHVQKVTFADEL